MADFSDFVSELGDEVFTGSRRKRGCSPSTGDHIQAALAKERLIEIANTEAAMEEVRTILNSATGLPKRLEDRVEDLAADYGGEIRDALTETHIAVRILEDTCTILGISRVS